MRRYRKNTRSMGVEVSVSIFEIKLVVGLLNQKIQEYDRENTNVSAALASNDEEELEISRAVLHALHEQIRGILECLAVLEVE